jgi:predicted Zn-dependent protease
MATIGQLLGSHQYQNALSQTDALLTQDPRNPRLWLARGLALRGLHRAHESLDGFEHALALQPGNSLALEGAAEAAFALHDSKADTFVEELLKEDPSNVTAEAMAGSLAYESHDCDRAIQFFEASRDILKANANAGLQFSYCLILTGKAAKAVEVLQALQQKHDTEMISFDLAYALFLAGQYQESASELERLRGRGVGTAELWNLLGTDYGKLNRVPAALTAYRNACEKAPTIAGYYIDLARFAMEHSSTGAALKVLNAGIERIPKSAALITVRGSIYSFEGDTGRADADFALAESVDPTSGYGRVGRSLLLSDQGKAEDAETLLRNELEKHPNDTEVKYFLAQALLKTPSPQNNQQAQNLLNEVLRERPNDSSVLLALAKTHLVKHENQEALALLLHAREVDEKSAPILNRLLQAYRALGMKQEVASTASDLRRVVDQDRAADLLRNRFQITATSQ